MRRDSTQILARILARTEANGKLGNDVDQASYSPVMIVYPTITASELEKTWQSLNPEFPHIMRRIFGVSSISKL